MPVNIYCVNLAIRKLKNQLEMTWPVLLARWKRGYLLGCGRKCLTQSSYILREHLRVYDLRCFFPRRGVKDGPQKKENHVYGLEWLLMNGESRPIFTVHNVCCYAAYTQLYMRY
jgi:hypothetical protein